MPSIRIVAAGAALLLLSSLTAGGATAQTATNQAPGKPLQLLRIAAQSHKIKPKPRAKLLANSIAKKTAPSATAERKQPRAQTATALPAASVWPAVNSAPPIGFAGVEPGAPPASAPAEPAPGELIVAGRTVKVASPDDVNEIDLAANDTNTRTSIEPPNDAAARTPAISETAAGEPKSDSLVTASAQPARSEVGSTSWLLQVLAAVGGAVAAGSTAWFLIGSTPQRMYG
jgi:hypothetical protein